MVNRSEIRLCFNNILKPISNQLTMAGTLNIVAIELDLNVNGFRLKQTMSHSNPVV